MQIREAINKAFELVANFHLLENELTTKLAVVPLAYFIFKKSMGAAILPTNAKSPVFNDMRKFLFCTIVRERGLPPWIFIRIHISALSA